jgi:branched-chain amino acid transport system permease protein
VTIVTGFIFAVCVLAFRRGIVGEFIAFLERRERGVASGRRTG